MVGVALLMIAGCATTAAAAFIPGDPEERLGGIQISVLGDSSQRDGLADAMVEFYRTMGSLDFDARGSGVDDITTALVSR